MHQMSRGPIHQVFGYQVFLGVQILLISVVIYMAFSLIMAIIWLILESPDVAITEAAVGAGVTSILFFVTLKKIRSIKTTAEEDIDE